MDGWLDGWAYFFFFFLERLSERFIEHLVETRDVHHNCDARGCNKCNSHVGMSELLDMKLTGKRKTTLINT